ncbi:hypothetical protein PYW07_004220 [Mythimna separata]|uniref:UDP-glycosyltransferase n=1 Tax=Mythimna separata TaxID=271217 RepID=A0AAD7YR43_MYTSE|nr:hypothetical protein PYW07_004220 [Mythimna separata]
MQLSDYVLLLCVSVQLCVCKRALVVFPVASRSHTLLGDHLVTTLLDGGHNVTYVTTFTRVKAADRLRIIDISSAANDDTLEFKNVPQLPDLSSSRLPSHEFLLEGTRTAERAVRHPDVQALMKDTAEEFDVVVAEWYYSGLLAPLAAVFECPLVWYSSVDASWMSLQLVDQPSSPTLFVDPMAAALPTLPPSVVDRVYRIGRQAYLSAWVYYITHYVETPAYYEIYQLAIQWRGRSPPFYEDLVHDGAMLLINSQPLLGQGLPLPHNAKYIGGHHVEGSDATLPKSLQQLVDSAKHGVIYFNLGGSTSEDLPVGTKQELLRAFRQVEQTVVWKYRGTLDYVPGNVHLVEKAPQLAMLKHPNTVMMITHGGYLSYLEAMYCGVPIISLPVKRDQLLTVDLAASRGRGVRVPLTSMIGYRVKEAILEMLGNYSYRSNAKEASVVLQNPLVPMRQELLYWVEHAMSTRGAPHLRSRALQLSAMERLHLDVLAVLAMLAWFLSKVAKLVKVYWDDFGTDCQDLDDKKND